MQIYVIVVCAITVLIIISNSLSIALLVCIALGKQNWNIKSENIFANSIHFSGHDTQILVHCLRV